MLHNVRAIEFHAGGSELSWERRGNRFYFYRAVRRGNRIVKEYIGTGDVARKAATIDRRARQLRQEQWMEAAARDQVRKELAALLDEMGALVDQLLACQLIAAGWKRHHRQWRQGNVRDDV